MRCGEKGNVVVSLDCAFVIEIVNKNNSSGFPVYGVEFQSGSAGLVPVNNSDRIETIFLNGKIKCCVIGAILEAG